MPLPPSSLFIASAAILPAASLLVPMNDSRTEGSATSASSMITGILCDCSWRIGATMPRLSTAVIRTASGLRVMTDCSVAVCDGRSGVRGACQSTSTPSFSASA